MKEIEALSIRYKNNVLEVMDQTALPAKEVWIQCDHPRDMIKCIKDLSVRGAPLIGVAAAMSLALFAETCDDVGEIKVQAAALRASRPTAVNLMWAIDRCLAALPAGMSKVAEEIADEDRQMCESIGKHGAALIGQTENILTHCNTGALVTMGGGTALNVIAEAHRQGKKVHVYVDETRPLLQGARLTTWELKRLGIPYTLICDNMAASLMRDGKIDRVILGADRIAANGDVANKIGTYSVAVLAKFHGVPFHSAAPMSTVDMDCPDGNSITIEQRAADEVRGASGGFGKVIWSPEDAPAHNPSFDWVPNSMVTSIILDIGAVGPEHWKK